MAREIMKCLVFHVRTKGLLKNFREEMTEVKEPRMILFDYGQTLVKQRPFDGVRGTEAVLKFATINTTKPPRRCRRLRKS